MENLFQFVFPVGTVLASRIHSITQTSFNRKDEPLRLIEIKHINYFAAFPYILFLGGEGKIAA